MNQPNIIILLTEDICTNFGCYGDTNANTPNIDAFAKDNIRFNYCSSAAPVCSAARTSLNLGMYGSTAGTGQHRSLYKLPPHIKNIGCYMQDAGYFTAIGKTDFNFPQGGGYHITKTFKSHDTTEFAEGLATVIDGAKTAGKPAFMIESIMCTHQSQYGYTPNAQRHRESMPRLQPSEHINREKVDVPAYHFDTTDAREVWGQYHEKMTTMDRMFGEGIAKLKSLGVYEDSIIIFAGDNGHGIPLGKAELWNEGCHVPMLMHIPDGMKHQLNLQTDQYGMYTDRLTCFVDYATTALSLAGAEIPQHLQGSVLVGSDSTENPNYMYSFGERVDEAFENSRCIRETNLFYTCDFGYSIYRRTNAYQAKTSPWFVASQIQAGYDNNIADTDRRAFFRGMPRIDQQLFDMTLDPSQLENIASKNPKDLKRLRKLMVDSIIKYPDGVFMPEPLMAQTIADTGLTAYEIIRNTDYYPVTELANLWETIMDGTNTLTTHENPCGKLLIMNHMFKTGNLDGVKTFANDTNQVVRTLAAYYLEDAHGLTEICSTTKNFILVLYIADLIAYWKNDNGKLVLDAIYNNFCVAHDYGLDDRYKSAIESALKMLSIRFKHQLPDENPFNYDVNLSEYIDTTDMILDNIHWEDYVKQS